MALRRKFMFIVPNTRWFGKRCWLWFTPAVCLLTPILKRAGYSVKVVEANIDNLTRDQVKDEIRAFRPDVVGITNMSLEYWRQAHVCAALTKEVDEDIVTVIGGVHCTSLPRRVMEDPNIDFVLLSEGEERLPKFMRILNSDSPDFSEMDGVGYRTNGEVTIIDPVTWVEDLDSYPLPDYSIFDWKKVMEFCQASAGGVSTCRAPVGVIFGSRGCPYKCCFCAGWTTMGRRARYRSAENVLKEIDMLVQDYGIKELVFQDDEMYGDRERAIAIIDGIKKRNYDLIWKNTNVATWRMDFELMKAMRESGCYQITISPESGSDRVLRDIIHKAGRKEHAMRVADWCKILGLPMQADFVIGFPGEKWDEIRETTNFAEELDADAVKFAVATPFPRTELFKIAVQQGYLPEDFDFYRDDALGFANPVIETEEFSATELRMIRCLEWDRINFKTEAKKERYARFNFMTVKEADEFRKETRRKLGVYFYDQAADERDVVDLVHFQSR